MVYLVLLEQLTRKKLSNGILTYDVRLGYKTNEMYEDSNSEWILEVQSRESRAIRCQPIYPHATEIKFVLFQLFKKELKILSECI
jgi:hypothetical protein